MLPVPWPFVKSSFHCIEVANLCQEVLDPLGSYMQVFTPGWGGGGTSLYEANGDVPLDGVAFSRLD